MIRNRRQCRAGEPCEPRSWDEVLFCVVHHSGISARHIAERVGCSYAYLLDATNPDRDSHAFQARWLIPIMSVTGNYSPMRYLAHQLGGVFVELPTLGSAHDDVRQAFLRVVQEIGEDATLIESALTDQEVSVEEATRIDAEIDESIAALLQVKAVVRRRAGQTRLQAVR